MSEIESKIKAIVKDKLCVDQAGITKDSRFTDDLGADSLDFVELVMDVEKEFGIAIPDKDLENINTVGEVIEYIPNHKQ